MAVHYVVFVFFTNKLTIFTVAHPRVMKWKENQNARLPDVFWRNQMKTVLLLRSSILFLFIMVDIFQLYANWSGNNPPMWRHFACSLKKQDVGYCGKLSGVRGSALLAKREGGNKQGSVRENLVNTEKYAAFVFIYFNNFYVQCVFNDRSFLIFPPLFQLTTHSHFLQKSFRSNPLPSFSNCIQSDVMLVLFCLTTFHKKQLYTTRWYLSGKFHTPCELCESG